jgi:hypothetical protein
LPYFPFWHEGLPALWAAQMLKVNPHLLVWREAGSAMRAGDVERGADLF